MNNHKQRVKKRFLKLKLGQCKRKGESCKMPRDDPNAQDRCCETSKGNIHLYCNPEDLTCKIYAPA